MKKLNLYSRSEEIYDKLPIKYREMIFNNILARSVSNGKLMEEAELYIPTEELKEILSNLEIEITTKRKKTEKKIIIKNKDEEIKEDKSKLFVY